MTHVVPKGGDSGSVAVPLDTLKEADIAAAIQQAAATFEENYSREFGFTLSDRYSAGVLQPEVAVPHVSFLAPSFCHSFLCRWLVTLLVQRYFG